MTLYLICEVNEEYFFWRPHGEPVDSIHASTKEEHHEDSFGVLDDTQQANDDNNNIS